LEKAVYAINQAGKQVSIVNRLLQQHLPINFRHIDGLEYFLQFLSNIMCDFNLKVMNVLSENLSRQLKFTAVDDVQRRDKSFPS